MIYAEQEKDECPFASINNVARGRILPSKQPDGIGEPPYPTKKQKSPKSSAQNDEVLQFKKSDSDEKPLEGIGENVANSKTDPVNSPDEKFIAKVKELKKEKQQKADAFWAMKGIVAPPTPLSKTNINYRDSLAQKVGGSNIAIIKHLWL